MMFDVSNNSVALKKDQSTPSGFFLELPDDKILEMIFFVVGFELYWYLVASICKHNNESQQVPLDIGAMVHAFYDLKDLGVDMVSQ